MGRDLKSSDVRRRGVGIGRTDMDGKERAEIRDGPGIEKRRRTMVSILNLWCNEP